MLSRIKDSESKKKPEVGTKSSKLVAFKKVIDGLIFPTPRKIAIVLPKGRVGDCQRPLRAQSAQTAQGERVEWLEYGSQAKFGKDGKGATMETNLAFTNVTMQRLIEIQKLIIKKNGTIHNIDTNISDILYSGTIRCSWPNTKTGRGNMTRFFLSIQPAVEIDRHVLNMGEPLKGIKMRLGEETTRPPIVVINEFNHHYGNMGSDCLFVKTLRDGGLNNEQIAIVINAVDNTCQECWNRKSGC